MKKTAIYPGTFDPITFGHIDLIQKSLKIVDKIISIKEETGYPFAFNTNWAKNSNENILNIASKLKKASMLRKMGLSLQSLNLDVLTNVKRKNMELELRIYF